MATTKKSAAPAAPKKAKKVSGEAAAPAAEKPTETDARVTKRRPAPGASAGQFAVPAKGHLGVLFGVRHLSPMAGRQLEALLRELQPTAVLIEGPADATPMIEHLVREDTHPPVALLAYTKQRPVRSIMYPLAKYSPEWVALRVGAEIGAWVRFMDLPASTFLALETRQNVAEKKGQQPEGTEPDSQESEGEDEDHEPEAETDSVAYGDDPYTLIAKLSGDPDHDTWWERTFEHNSEAGAYRDAVYAFGEQLRNLREDPPARQKETLLREAYMRRVIRDTINAGHDPAKIVVVCGAFHASVLTAEEPAMTDKEHAALPSHDSTITVMPYSYFRLSAQSGYGAGNNAPGYYQALYEELAKGSAGTGRLGIRVLSELAGKLRNKGHVRSSAEVIEAARLALGMAALHGEALAPTLQDLRDAAVTCLGYGEAALIDEALHDVAVGDAIGKVPPGVARTSLQDDFYHQLDALKLSQYLVDRAQHVEGRASDKALDMREDLRASNKDTALRDRSRSIFLHRLVLTGVPFAKLDRSGSEHVEVSEDPPATQHSGSSRASRKRAAPTQGALNTFKEYWTVRWTPNCEISLAETSLKGDSVEVAAARTLEEQLGDAQDVAVAARLVRKAVLCALPEGIRIAVRRLQSLGVDDASFGSIAAGVYDLAYLESYGNVRQFDPAPLKPIVAQLFLRATLLAHSAANVNDEGASAVADALSSVHYVAGLSGASEQLPVERWYAALTDIAEDDAANPFVCGASCALLLERGQASDEDVERRVAKRILPGMDPDAVSGFFSGLASRNRYALLARKIVWKSLSDFLDTLTDEDFRRSVAGLRKSFAGFEPAELRRVAEILGELWGAGGAELVQALDTKLDEGTVAKLTDDLAGLDLDLDL